MKDYGTYTYKKTFSFCDDVLTAYDEMSERFYLKEK